MSRRVRTGTSLFSSVIVGVDGGGLADHAIRVALDLGRRTGAKVGLIHAVAAPPLQWPGVDPVRSAALTAEILTSAWSNATRQVRSAIGMEEPGAAGEAGAPEPGTSAPTPMSGAGASAPASVARAEARRAEGGGTAVANPPAEDLVRVLPGIPAKVLLDEARRTKADVIFLGTHRKRGAVDFGGTTRAVLAKASGAVWVQTHPVRPIRRILAPVDLSEDSLDALASACGLARVHGASVRVVHCFSSTSYSIAGGLDYPGLGPAFRVEEVRKADLEEFQKTMAAFDWKGVEHEIEFLDGDPAERIPELSRTADLVVLGTHGRTGLAAAVLGNVAYAVLKRSETPVLAIRHPERRFLA